jgi:tetratricopeptide (TPR) repeat protein
MKKQILIVGIMLISTLTFAQKKELKKADKALKDNNYTEALSYLNQIEGLISASDNSIKSDYYLFLGKAKLGDAGNDFEKLNSAGDALGKVLEINPKGSNAIEAEAEFLNLRDALINSAILDQNAKENSLAAKKLYRAYKVSKQDTAVLYYAAGNAVNAREYDNAIAYYQELLDLNFTGIVVEYFANDKTTGEKQKFNSKTERDLVCKSGNFINPLDISSESKRGDILRNMTLIYVSTNNSEKATELMQKARKENPDDIALMRAEAEMYYNAGDMVGYKKIITEIISRDPDNPELYYNLGVASKKNNEIESAMKFYDKAIELKPDYAEAIINKADLILSKEGGIIEEMNSLGTSNADYDRYDELKEIKNEIYKEALPYLEKASSLRASDVDLIRTLKNIYSLLAMDDKAKLMQSRLKELGVED